MKITIPNTGNYDIDEVAQLYVCPYNNTESLPLKRLKRFKRVSLKNGSKQTISFKFKPEQVMVDNAKGEKVWRKGKYRFFVGNASPGELSTHLGAAVAQEALVF